MTNSCSLSEMWIHFTNLFPHWQSYKSSSSKDCIIAASVQVVSKMSKPPFLHFQCCASSKCFSLISFLLYEYRFLKALSFASLDKEDLLSPISQTSLQRSSSVRSMVSSATYGNSDDYIGLALPMDINSMFQVTNYSMILFTSVLTGSTVEDCRLQICLQISLPSFWNLLFLFLVAT